MGWRSLGAILEVVNYTMFVGSGEAKFNCLYDNHTLKAKDQTTSNTESNVEKLKKGVTELVSILKDLCRISNFLLGKLVKFIAVYREIYIFCTFLRQRSRGDILMIITSIKHISHSTCTK